MNHAALISSWYTPSHLCMHDLTCDACYSSCCTLSADLPTKTDELEGTAKKKEQKKVSARQQEIWDRELPDVPWLEILQLNLKHWWEKIIILLGLVGATVQVSTVPGRSYCTGQHSAW